MDSWDSQVDAVNKIKNKILNIGLFKDYYTNDVEDLGSIMYVGKENKDGDWVIMRIEDSSGVMSLRYATKKNNETVTSYNDAWTNRAALNYDYIKNVI